MAPARKIAIVGGGIIGATIAYELTQHLAAATSQTPDQDALNQDTLDQTKHANLRSIESVTLFDRQTPGNGATGAAFGLCMGVISRKTKGRAWDLRHRSLQRYPQLLASLADHLGHPLPHNPRGIVKLCFDPDERPRWQRLADLRQTQGYSLHLWDPETLHHHYGLPIPHLAFAIASPQDWQLQPRPLTQALLHVAQARGLTLHTDTPVHHITPQPSGSLQVTTATGVDRFDRVILTAGLPSPSLLPPDLLANAPTPFALEPVLGQGARIRLPRPLSPQALPVLTAHDIHLVPLDRPLPDNTPPNNTLPNNTPPDYDQSGVDNAGVDNSGSYDYWLGATLEFQPDRRSDSGSTFGPDSSPWIPRPQDWEHLWTQALALWPSLAEAEVLETWAGARPRPLGRSAPIIEPWPGAESIVLATGHYRNGVLLAPATAQRVLGLL